MCIGVGRGIAGLMLAAISPVTITRQSTVAVVAINHSRVNALSRVARQGLLDALAARHSAAGAGPRAGRRLA
jgi:hypothetical protein